MVTVMLLNGQSGYFSCHSPPWHHQSVINATRLMPFAGQHHSKVYDVEETWFVKPDPSDDDKF